MLSRSGKKCQTNFYINDHILENVNRYMYLGIEVSASGALTDAKINLRNKSRKAQFKLQSILWGTNIKAKVSLKLFDQLIQPISTYGCEYWGVPLNPKTVSEKYYDNLPQEKVHLSFMRFALGVNKYTPNNGVRGELGRFPLYIFIKIQIFKYLKRLYNEEGGTLVQKAFRDQCTMHNSKSWLSTAKVMATPVGNNYYCTTVDQYVDCIKKQYIDHWTSETVLSSGHKLDSYSTYKKNI